ncbi:MAG: iron uptake porin [Cyanobacteria bacterium J06648_10]
MTNWKVLLAAPAALGVLSVSGEAFAAETVESAEISSEVVVAEPIQLAQVTNVSELSDVQPGDWAFTALQRLVEEYGCLEGYPDRTYRGNRALTRYEFAAGLNACLDVVLQLIGDGDLEEIRRLQEEFAAELATIRGRVDTLETDVAELEANQFSTTTKLRGSLDAHLVIPFGDAEFEGNELIQTVEDDPDTVGVDESEFDDEADALFEYRARLNFDTSFTGEDRLRIRLQAGDSDNALANTRFQLGGGGLASSGGSGDNVTLNDVYYSFPVGNRISAIIAANSVVTDDFVTSTIVPFDGPAVADTSGPEFYDLFEGGDFGAGVNFAFSDNLVLDLGYSSQQSNVNSSDTGLFNNNSYIAQLNFLTDGILDAAITYIGAGDAGSGEAESTIAGLINLDFGGFQVGGHYANTDIDGEGDVDSFTGGVAFPDFLGAGNEFGVYGGISPAIDRDPVLVEAYYNINVNEFFSFTPAVIYTDNDSGDDSETVYGAVRASFSF